MAVFFFHIRNGDEFVEDEVGSELPDLERAHDEAILAARELISEMVLAGKLVNGQQFEITTEDGTIADVVPFRSALRLA